MYVPKAFRIDDIAWVRDFVDAHPFGTLVTIRDGEPFATHVPFLIDPEPSPYGTLRAHMARENPHWRAFEESPSLVIFAGPHAYVSPSWYRSDGPKVPTWNYATVHIYGQAHAIEDTAKAEKILRRLIEREESGSADPWTFERVDEPYRREMIHHIVAFEIPIERFEAKAKLSQNRPPIDRRLVADALGGEIAELMEELVLRTKAR
jgi:transcriptional regulator